MRGRPSPARIVTAAIILSGLLGCVAIAWPGYISYDSALQLLQGRDGSYNTWHPPVMAWLLGVADAVAPGAGLFVVFDAALLCAAMLLLLRLSARPPWVAAFVAALCVLSPQFLIYQGIVWKDVLFADASVAGFASLACAGANWRDMRARFAFIALAIVPLVLAALTRQNGVIVMLFGAIALATIAGSFVGRQRFREGIRYGAVMLLIAAVLFIGASLALETRGDDGYGRLSQVKALQLYDIAGMVAAQPDVKLDGLRKSRPALETLIRSDGARLFSPQSADPLVTSAALQKALVVTPEKRLLEQWLDLVAGHFGLYFRVRAEIFRWVTLTPDIGKCHPYYVGVSGPPDVMRRLGLDDHTRPGERALFNYGKFFVGTPVFSHVPFAAIAFAALIILFRRRAPADIAISFMLASALVFTLTFFVISIACDYRYLHYLDLSALVASFYLALNVRAYPGEGRRG